MIEFIKSNNRVLCCVFACFIALMLIMSFMTPVAFAAEEVEVKPIDLSKYPFNELPADYPVYWILKSADGSYVYMGSNSSDTSIQLTKGAISTATYSASVNGKGCTQYKYTDGSWQQTYQDTSSYYNWFSINDVSAIEYCSVPVYIKNGEELTLVYPKPPLDILETVVVGGTTIFSVIRDDLAFMLDKPLLLVPIAITFLGFAIVIFKSINRA